MSDDEKGWPYEPMTAAQKQEHQRWMTGEDRLWAVPSQVWVALVVTTAEVHVKDIPVGAAPGRVTLDSLFAATRVEARTTARAVACCASEDQCRKALAGWQAQNPEVVGEAVVQAVAYGRPKQPPIKEVYTQCIGCGADIPRGFRCDRCTQEFWAQARAADQEMDEVPST